MRSQESGRLKLNKIYENKPRVALFRVSIRPVMATVKCTLVREKPHVIIRSEAFSQCTSFRISNPYLSPDFCTCVKTNHRPLLPKGFIGSSENISHTEHNTFPGSQIHPGPPLSGNGSLIYSATPVGSLGCVLRLFPHTKSRQVSLLSNP